VDGAAMLVSAWYNLDAFNQVTCLVPSCASLYLHLADFIIIIIIIIISSLLVFSDVCDIALSVTENHGNSTSSESSSVNFNVVCGPVQRKRNSIPLLQPFSKRQESGGGPSGSLNTPTGGTSYTSPDDSINIVYQPVTEGGQTFGIDAALTSDFGNYTVSRTAKQASTSLRYYCCTQTQRLIVICVFDCSSSTDYGNRMILQQYQLVLQYHQEHVVHSI
jgi:hypothetical protein